MVRVGNNDTAPRVAFSTDNGANWFQGSEPSGVTGGGTVAAAADASGFVWSPDGTGVNYTTGYGSSWTASTGVPAGATVESDRKNAKKFYAFKSGTFYVSTDSGKTFAATAATGLPADGPVRFKAVPGTEGDIWLAGGATTGSYGLWHSTDSGASFSKLSNVQQADTIGFGKAATGASYQALYTSAKIGGVRGIFRSTDAGASWVRINDDAHQYGWTGAAITGDPRVYGRVYVSTNGRGVLYADTSDTTGGGTATPTPTATPTTSPTTGPSPTTSPTTTTSPAGCAVTYGITSQWNTGFQGDVSIRNTGSSAVNGWTLAWTFPNGQTISQLWSASWTQAGSTVTATALSWNSTIAAGASVSFGFTAGWSGTNGKPTAFTLNGAACTVT